MAELFSYDPVFGVKEYFDWDAETGNATITTVQDVEKTLEWTKEARNLGYADRGIRESWWHYATIPMNVCLKMMAKGLNPFDGRQADRIAQEINEHYPALKMTEKNHGGKVKLIST